LLEHPSANLDVYALTGLINVKLEYAPWIPFFEESPAATESGFHLAIIGEQRPPNEFQVGAVVNLRNEETIGKYWDAVTGRSLVNRSLRRALGRFVRARAAVLAEDVITHAIIGVVSLLGDSADRGSPKVIRRATALIVHPDGEPAVAELERMKLRFEDLYRPRHLIFHGRDVSEESLSSRPLVGSSFRQTLSSNSELIGHLLQVQNRWYAHIDHFSWSPTHLRSRRAPHPHFYEYRPGIVWGFGFRMCIAMFASGIRYIIFLRPGHQASPAANR
jgi:hypothetical protein